MGRMQGCTLEITCLGSAWLPANSPVICSQACVGMKRALTCSFVVPISMPLTCTVSGYGAALATLSMCSGKWCSICSWEGQTEQLLEAIGDIFHASLPILGAQLWMLLSLHAALIYADKEFNTLSTRGCAEKRLVASRSVTAGDCKARFHTAHMHDSTHRAWLVGLQGVCTCSRRGWTG